ncbi:Hypothetical protein GLP15_4382 [Giardia lamblia P15]|uniref:Uncharacterized protein n=1 Tax=Giardia intestinalis (strain P15) TaxID=658858 RepID=E1F9K9_GIAIA|nr:Hypothetical protein GLP15_4382 [Giardia lamblia P15]
MQAFYIISRISGTLLFAKEFFSEYSQDEGALEPVLTPARAFTFSPLRNHNALLGNMSAPQLYWSLYLNMMDTEVYGDTYYVTNDALVVFSYCPHSVLAVGVFEVPMAHLSLVVGCLHRDELSDSKDVDALFQTSIYATDANDVFDESSIDGRSRIKSAVDDYQLVEHADDYVFHASALVRRLGTSFTTAFDKTLQKCSTSIKSRFKRFELVLPSILADWFGQYILRSITLVMCPTGAAQLLVLTCHTHKDTISGSSEPHFCQTELVAQEPATLVKVTPRGELPPIEQGNTNIVYFSTPILTRESPGYRYPIQKTPRRSKVARKITTSTTQLCLEASVGQPSNYSYRVVKAYLETGLCSDSDILSKDFYCCLSDVITTMMATEQTMGGSVEDGCTSLFINFSSIKYRLMVFWQDTSRALCALVLKDSSLNGRHIPFWFPFLLPPLVEL